MSDPLFPFGYGLSYTTFAIGNAVLNKTEIKKGDNVQLTFPVTNTGKSNGTEVVQVYLRKVNDTTGLIKTLKGFQRIEIPAGKTREAMIELPYDSFEFYDGNTYQMDIVPGEYDVWYGTSSDAKDLKQVKIKVD